MEWWIILLIIIVAIIILIPLTLMFASVIPYATRKHWKMDGANYVKRRRYINGKVKLYAYKNFKSFKVVETDKDNMDAEGDKLIAEMKE